MNELMCRQHVAEVAVGLSAVAAEREANVNTSVSMQKRG